MIDQDDSPESVGLRLQRVREILGLSKREFAERAGLTEQNYGMFENGKRPLTLVAAKRLRATYSLTLEYIFFGRVEELPHRIAREL